MNAMDEVEAVCRAWYGKKWDGDEKERPGEKMKDIWRKFAREAIAAIDRSRIHI